MLVLNRILLKKRRWYIFFSFAVYWMGMTQEQCRFQRTLGDAISYSGVGIHTGKEVSLRFCPAPENTGVVFQRVDLLGKPKIPASIDYVQETSRSTTIGIGSVKVHTVEHVMAALAAYSIDNIIVQVTEAEPPIGDGSSKKFVEMIEEVGIEEQSQIKPLLSLRHPVMFSKGESHLVALPASEYRISYTLHYPNISVIRSQFFSTFVNASNFKENIAPCRTFALYEEIATLMEKGLIKGGSLENAVVIKDDVIFSKEGLRFSDEMVRHKVLDLIGDLALIGVDFAAHVIAIRSGHATNVALGKELLNHFLNPGILL